MAQRRVGGTVYVKVNGRQYQAKGNFEVNLGQPKREAQVGADGVHGYKEMPQAPYVEGEITDSGDLDLIDLTNITDATVTVELASDKTVLFREAWYAADGTVGSEEGSVKFRFEAMSATVL